MARTVNLPVIYVMTRKSESEGMNYHFHMQIAMKTTDMWSVPKLIVSIL